MSLKYGILGLLAERPLHGYEVKNRFESLLGGSWEVNFGQVYTTLQRLERDQMVEAVGRRGDRGKQAYRLTDVGREALEEWLTRPGAKPQQLREAIYVTLPLSTRQAHGRRPHVYLQLLKDLSELEEQARRDGRDDLVLLFMGGILHTEADLKWTEACAEEMRHTKRKERGRP